MYTWQGTCTAAFTCLTESVSMKCIQDRPHYVSLLQTSRVTQHLVKTLKEITKSHYPCAQQYLVKLSVVLKGNLMQYAKLRDFPPDNSVSFTCKYQVDVSPNFEII